MPESKRPLKVFLCHAHADRDPVRALYARLTKDGVDAWLDKEKLVGGEDWEYEIRNAVRESDIVVVCHSKQFNQKGFRQKEVKIALEEADLLPKGEIFIIPVRLEECDVLDDLKRWHWVDLFEADGYERLLRALRVRADKIGATLQLKRSWLPGINTKSVVSQMPSALIKKPVETKQERPKAKTVKELSKPFNKKTIVAFSFVVLVIVAIFGLPPLIGKPEPTPTKTFFPMSFTATLSETPNPNITPTFTPTPTEILLPVATALGGGAGKIVFTSYKDGNGEIYAVNADGSDLTNLTNNSVNDYIQSLSPDGKRILFRSSRDGAYDNLYIMETNGENLINLTNTKNGGSFKGWSPDGSKVIFSSNRTLFIVNIDGTDLINLSPSASVDEVVGWSKNGDKLLLAVGKAWGSTDDGEIYCVNIDGSDFINLTNHKSDDWFEAWLPSGDGIIFGSDRDDNTEIYRVNLDGLGMKNLTEKSTNDKFQSFSLDGRKIIFHSISSESNNDIYIVNVDGTEPLPLTINQGNNWFKSISPDGEKMIFETDRDGNVEIYIANANGSGPINLTSNIGEDRFHSWMPDGSSILFYSNRNNNRDYFVVNLDGTGLANLTKNPEHDNFISWSPNSDEMLFSYEEVTTYQGSNQDGSTYSRQDKNVVFYTMNSDGTNLVTLTSIPKQYDWVRSAFWSPDGSKLILPLEKKTYYSNDTFIVDKDDSNIVKLENADDPIWVP